ncbi:hypothetical protein K6K13_03015 [Symbiopectobacterium purcellii]|uniref:Uncharacterized protein n=1 Tax=Symbiopectobacterium purcellii TaxID=2871826 RepID=A0ABX9AT25_9ENTR|nr:hypothetical protein K6K13_03015 [Symbiopectobacterium purcellii]
MLRGWQITGLALLAGIALGGYVQGLRWSADVAERGQKASDEISAGQQAVIAGQAFQFQRFNEIARQANQYGINIRAQSDEKQRVYRTIIKCEPASRRCVPDDVASRLLDYTNSLRASAMHTATGKSDAASVSAITTACRLTYAQAVYWIDPLLTVIDQANSQLSGIREIEGSRNH